MLADLSSLRSLNLPLCRLDGAELLPAAVRTIGTHCTELVELHVRFHYSVRDEDLRGWASLHRLTSRGSWFISEPAVAAILAASPGMEEIILQQFQGKVGSMLGPVEGMAGLRRLKISLCRLDGVTQLEGVLRSVGASLQDLSVRWAGTAPDIAAAVTAALPHIPQLRELELSFQGVMAHSIVAALASAIARATTLTALKVSDIPVFFNIETVGVPNEVMEWEELKALTQLRSLAASTRLGWRQPAFATVCAAATNLRSLELTDAHDKVTDEWMAAAGALPRLMQLSLAWCHGLGPDVLVALHGATALTEFRVRASREVWDGAAVEQLRAALPCLTSCNVHS